MSEAFEGLYQLVFFAVVLLLATLERIGSVRRQPVELETRWATNIGLFLIGSVVTRVVLPVAIIAFAVDQPPGVMSRLGFPVAAQWLLTFLFLDLWRYVEHRVFHSVPFLWRLHLVHHSDTQIDVTSSERHHPLEVLLSVSVLLTLIVLLGLPAEALGLYLLVAMTVALWSHANLRLPSGMESWLSRCIVTPGVHAVHHSVLQAQTDSNYGAVLTVWDRLFGSYTDPNKSKIEYFGLGYFHQPQDTLLSRVLLQPFLFRRSLAYPEREPGHVEPALIATACGAASGVVLSRGWRNALLGAMAGGVGATLVMWPTVLELVALWGSNEAYRYAWLVMPMVVYLLGWHFREEILVYRPEPGLAGVIVAASAAACWGAATLMSIDVGRQFAFILALQGIAMAALGWRLYWRLCPILALMFLMVPSGDLLQPALRLLTVKAIGLFAQVAHLPHRIEGFSILMGEQLYFVVDACAGLSYVTLTFFLGYCFGLLLFRSVVKVAALALFGAFFGIFSNLLRVNAIVLIDWVRGSQMDLAAHGTVQWVALLIALAVLFYVLSQLKAEAPPIAPLAVSAGQPSSSIRYAPAVAGLSVLFIAGVLAWVPTDSPEPSRERQALPPPIPGWELATPAETWSVDQQSRTESLSLTYRRNGQEMRVMVIETLSPSAKLPESRLAPGAREIWRDVLTSKQESCMASGCLTLLHTTWQRGKKHALRHVYYAYGIGSFNTDSRLVLRAAKGWHRLTGSHSKTRLIGVTLDGDAPSIDEVAAAYRMVQSALT